MRPLKWLLSLAALAASAAAAQTLDPGEAEQGFKLIFNGKDMTGWKLRNPNGKNGWTITTDGVLSNKPPSTDLVSEKKYENFQVRYEYRQFGNSGVGLRGRYEIAIDDSFGKEPGIRSDGAIYSQ